MQKRKTSHMVSEPANSEMYSEGGGGVDSTRKVHDLLGFFRYAAFAFGDRRSLFASVSWHSLCRQPAALR